MNVSTGDAVASSDRLKKRNEIMNNKYLNAWQKKHLLDELDAAESRPAVAALQQPTKPPDTKDKPRIVRPANPFTYLNGPKAPDKAKSPEAAAGGSGGGGAPPAVPGPSKPPAPTQTPAPPAATKPEPPPRPDATPAPAANQPNADKTVESPKPSSPLVNPYESRKQAILNDKSLNIHQKRYLLDELEAKYGNGSDAAPTSTPTVTVPYGLNGGDRQKAQDIAANDSMPDSQKKALMAHYEQKAKETLKYSRYNQLLQEIMNDGSLPPEQKKRQAGELKDRYYPGISKTWQDVELSKGDMFFLQNNAGAAEIPEDQRVLLMLKLQKDGQITGEGLRALGIDAGNEADFYAAYLTLAYKSAQVGMTYEDLDTAYWEEKVGQAVAASLARWGTGEPEEGLFGRTPKGKMARVKERFSQIEIDTMNETRIILNSPEIGRLRKAQKAGKPLQVKIGGRTILYEPDLPDNYSAMTLYGENGFIIGNKALNSYSELHKTILQELYRLNTSISAGGVSGELASQETAAAFGFSNKAYEEMTR